MLKQSFIKRVGIVVLAAIFVVAAVVFLVRNKYADRMFMAPPQGAAVMMLGGKVEQDGTASDWLAYRALAAFEVSEDIGGQLVLSGDNGWKRADEISAVHDVFVRELEQVPVFQVDGKVARTIDSCWRAKNVLGIERMVVVTQAFHLPRALYLCNELGVDTYGVVAPKGQSGLTRAVVRDWAASALAFWDIHTRYIPQHIE